MKVSIAIFIKSIILYLFASTLLFFLSEFVQAQSPMAFRSYTVNDGLSHNFVRSTVQDSRGFIWIATVDGLNRFDGYSFQVYKAEPEDSSSLSSSNIICLIEDKNENLWIGTGGGGLCIYNKKLDNFHRIPIAEGGNDTVGIATNFINCLYTDSKDRLWIGSNNNGLFLADPDSLTFVHYPHNPDAPKTLSDKEVASISEDENGKLWIGTRGGGINWFDPETGEFMHFKHQQGNKYSLSSNSVNSVLYDSKKRLWVSTNDFKVNLMKNGSGKFIHFEHKDNDSHSLDDYEVIDMEESGDHKIWIGSNYGLYIYDEAHNYFDRYLHQAFDPKSLSSNQIKSINRDSQGRMWIGTLNGGVNLFDNSFVKVLHYYHRPDNNSLSINDVTAFVEDDDGSILIGAEAGGLNIFDRKTDKFTHFLPDPDDPNSIATNLIKSILKDRKGRIWIGMWAGGIDRFDREKRIFTHLKINERDNWLRGAHVTCLTEDNNGIIWASTWASGVIKYDPDQNSFEHFTYEENNFHGLSESRAWAILADQENNIWVGSSNGILERYDRENGRFIHFDTSTQGESSNVILALFEDSKGRIWVGMEGGGLKLFSKRNSSFKTYKVEDGLPSNYISSIEEDQHGNLWLGTNNGISRFNPETENIENYGLRYGLQSLLFNRLSSICLKSGEMMFGGINGFNIFHPDSLSEAKKAIPIVFIDFQIFNKPVLIGKKNSPLQAHINETQAITLSHDQSVFRIEYAGLYYPDPENIQYTYRLKGFVDENWQEAGKERKVTYTNLKPGRYIFEAAVVGNEDNYSRTLNITVTPPWWQTLWARALAFLMIFAVLAVSYKKRVKNIEIRNKKLEEEVAERTNNLKKVNNALSSSQNQLKYAYDHIKLKTDALNQIAIIIESDTRGCITEVNQMFLETTGFDKNEIIGKSYFELQDVLYDYAQQSPHFFSIIKQPLASGQTWRGEVRCRSCRGETVWFLKNMIPVYDKGEFTGYFSFSYDITLKKKREEEIVEAKRIAEEASATKENFLSVMSHEIRTPLNSVIGLSNLLLSRSPREDQLEIVKTLKNSGDNLMYLINNILDYNKIRAGKIEVEKFTFDLNEQLSQLRSAYQPVAWEKGLDFKVSIAFDVPTLLVGDSMRLSQILNNLIHNAFKFTSNGHVKLSVSKLSSDNDNCRLLFVVEDTGIGISEKKLKFVFDPFHQSERNISRRFGGTGLGLSIVKDLIDLLNGEIKVKSQIDKGTTFEILLPFGLGNGEPGPSYEIFETRRVAADSLTGYRILYVEDVESNQILLKNFLGDRKINCIVASNGETALSCTLNMSFDVILMDIQMPGMNGYETASAIRTQKNGKNLRTPIIAFTAEPYSDSLKSKIIQAGMQDLITKPFRFEVLIEKIAKVCPHRISEQEFLSFEYYDWVFNHDKKRLEEFKNMLFGDFKDFETSFYKCRRKKDIQGLRTQIHKMAPIVKNLRCTTLIDLFEKYGEAEEYNPEIDKLNLKVEEALHALFSFLKGKPSNTGNHTERIE